MAQVPDIKELVAEVLSNLDEIAVVPDIAKKVLTEVTEKIPPEKAAELFSIIGKWFGDALSPLAASFKKAEADWFNRQVSLIKEATGAERISEEAAVQLISIRAKSWNNRMKSLKDRHVDSKSTKRSSGLSDAEKNLYARAWGKGRRNN